MYIDNAQHVSSSGHEPVLYEITTCQTTIDAVNTFRIYFGYCPALAESGSAYKVFALERMERECWKVASVASMLRGALRIAFACENGIGVNGKQENWQRY